MPLSGVLAQVSEMQDTINKLQRAIANNPLLEDALRKELATLDASRTGTKPVVKSTSVKSAPTKSTVERPPWTAERRAKFEAQKKARNRKLHGKPPVPSKKATVAKKAAVKKPTPSPVAAASA